MAAAGECAPSRQQHGCSLPRTGPLFSAATLATRPLSFDQPQGQGTPPAHGGAAAVRASPPSSAQGESDFHSDTRRRQPARAPCQHTPSLARPLTLKLMTSLDPAHQPTNQTKPNQTKPTNNSNQNQPTNQPTPRSTICTETPCGRSRCCGGWGGPSGLPPAVATPTCCRAGGSYSHACMRCLLYLLD